MHQGKHHDHDPYVWQKIFEKWAEQEHYVDESDEDQEEE